MLCKRRCEGTALESREPRYSVWIAIRVDPSVLESFCKEARRRHVGYQTLIHEVLAEHVRKDVAQAIVVTPAAAGSFVTA
jgi:uncharacterized protein (DUF4415 family)